MQHMGGEGEDGYKRSVTLTNGGTIYARRTQNQRGRETKADVRRIPAVELEVHSIPDSKQSVHPSLTTERARQPQAT